VAGADGADTVGVEAAGTWTVVVEMTAAVEITGERRVCVEIPGRPETAAVETEVVVIVMLDDGTTFKPGDADVAVPEDVVVPVCACARDGDSKTAAKSVLIASRFTPKKVYKIKNAWAIAPGVLYL